MSIPSIVVVVVVVVVAVATGWEVFFGGKIPHLIYWFGIVGLAAFWVKYPHIYIGKPRKN